MADNPLLDDTDRERRIRERAYRLWEADDRPPGRDLEYWERARALIGMEDSAGAGPLPVPLGDPPPKDHSALCGSFVTKRRPCTPRHLDR